MNWSLSASGRRQRWGDDDNISGGPPWSRASEFGSRVLEALRQPMEDKAGAISRAQGSLTFPVNFQLVTVEVG